MGEADVKGGECRYGEVVENLFLTILLKLKRTSRKWSREVEW